MDFFLWRAEIKVELKLKKFYLKQIPIRLKLDNISNLMLKFFMAGYLYNLPLVKKRQQK